MAQAKGGAIAKVLMIGAFVVIGGIFYWLSVNAVPAPAPVAVEAPEEVTDLVAPDGSEPGEAPTDDASAN